MEQDKELKAMSDIIAALNMAKSFQQWLLAVLT